VFLKQSNVYIIGLCMNCAYHQSMYVPNLAGRWHAPSSQISLPKQFAVFSQSSPTIDFLSMHEESKQYSFDEHWLSASHDFPFPLVAALGDAPNGIALNVARAKLELPPKEFVGELRFRD
jgi:hypothetical protein